MVTPRTPLASLPLNVHSVSHPPEVAGRLAGKSSPLPAAGTKRKSDVVDADSDEDDENDSIPDGTPVDKNADQIRRMINAFIENGEMKVGEFQKAINVSSGSYLRFMKQSGPSKGTGADTYWKAWEFFKKRERKGIPMPKRKSAKTSKSSKADTSKTSQKSGVDITDVHLDGEDTDSVPIFDTCTEIRRKIGMHLRNASVTNAQFCRDLQAQYHTSRGPAKIQGGQIQRFRSRNQPLAGCTNSVYYAAYVFFEKMRIKQKKPKSKHRLEMEKRWPRGVDTSRDTSTT